MRVEWGVRFCFLLNEDTLRCSFSPSPVPSTSLTSHLIVYLVLFLLTLVFPFLQSVATLWTAFDHGTFWDFVHSVAVTVAVRNHIQPLVQACMVWAKETTARGRATVLHETRVSVIGVATMVTRMGSR